MVLGTASVLSFPSVGAAQPAPPEGLRAAVLTPDGTDGYVLTDGPDHVTAASAAREHEHQPPTAVLAQRRADRDRRARRARPGARRRATSCSRAPRCASAPTPGGAVRAITVTKNVYVHSFWIFNVHVWDTDGSVGREIAELRPRLGVPVQRRPLRRATAAVAALCAHPGRAGRVQGVAPHRGRARVGRPHPRRFGRDARRMLPPRGARRMVHRPPPPGHVRDVHRSPRAPACGAPAVARRRRDPGPGAHGRPM